jgi:hydrogenase maturation protein HypF
MSNFEMCEPCRIEYTSPSDRRYHAQPVSCHQCGPSLFFADERGNIMDNVDCLKKTIEIIKAGKIAAIKGIGGYHLACSAIDEAAVDRLRARKHRDDKPFAVMMRDTDTVRKYCYVNEKELQLLQSPASPIVLLEKKARNNLAHSIAPLNRYLGVMLPYTPVHYLLFEDAGFPEVLVMTSGNLSSEPIFFRDDEAVDGLVGIADAFLINNREIYIRTDDSVTRVFNNKEYIIRRSRGYVPLPVKLDIHRLLGLEPETEIPSVLACGGELKNVFCLSKGDLFYMSHHIGDLENDETNSSFRQAIDHFIQLFETKPQIAAYDMHPGYFSSRYGAELDIFKAEVQHHKAHIASCMAENELTGQVIGVSFDGTGFGEDNNIWGGEFFVGGYRNFIRAGHLAYVKMPGGDAAVKHPWRMALSQLSAAGLQMESDYNGCSLPKQSDIDFITAMLDRNINCPLTSSMGRLFDAVSALLGIKTDISYEGQAAIELEYYSGITQTEPYSFEIAEYGDTFEIETTGIITGIVQDLHSGKTKEEIASKFHSTAAKIVVKGCCEIRKKFGLTRVVLSGGVFQNVTLLKMAFDELIENEFEVFTHSEIPANDAGIAVGQAIIALARYFDIPT